MRIARVVPVLIAALALAGCAAESPPPAAVAERALPEPVRRMIEAHGGMDAWRAAPSVRFTEHWEGGAPTRVTVEQGGRRVHQEIVGGTARIGWDGTQAWSVGWQGPPPRFMAQLNYYFLNLPWLTMDPGVRLGEPATARLWDDPTEYISVMMTFDDGIGDTPRDYYELFIHPETHILRGCRYTVTYRSLLQPGQERTPDHILVFGQHERVNGLLVPTRFTIYNTDHSQYAACGISDWSFAEPFDPQQAMMPAGAVVDTTRP